MAKSKANPDQSQVKVQEATECEGHGEDHGDAHGHHAHGQDLLAAKSPAALADLENELNNREIAIIEREIKSLRLQEEVDRLRPLSGLYRVVKAMATERRLDS